MLLKMGEICLLLIRLALSTPRASGVISLDKWTWKEWMLCLSPNLIQPLSTTKLLRQRKSPGKFTKRFSPHWLLEQSTPGQSCAKQDQGYVWFHSKQTLHQSMSLHLPGWRCANHWNYLKVEVGMIKSSWPLATISCIPLKYVVCSFVFCKMYMLCLEVFLIFVH